MPTGVYPRDVKRIMAPIRYLPDYGSHYCQQLSSANKRRMKNQELPICVFKDEGEGFWHMRVGLEFVEMNFCPYCGRRLWL